MGMANNNLCDSCINIGCIFQSGIKRTECAFYIPSHNDNVKQKLLDSLAEEPTMVLSTAYAYAKNYVMYGEDITKAWTTAVQQASVIQEVRQKAWVEAYDSFKKDYENRLKADLKAILVELQLEIEELDFFEGEEPVNITQELMDEVKNWEYGVKDCKKLIQEKINALGDNENV